MFRWVRSRLGAVARDESGSTAIEYGLMVAVLGVLVILSANFLAAEAGRVADEIADTFKSAKSE